MPSLRDLQDAVAGAILGGVTAAFARELTAGGASALDRFNIYRNNTRLSLAAHLKAVFPVTARLADERFFAYAADTFILQNPPREPRLSAYGGALPRFLAGFPAARQAPVLTAMASLEWAVHASLVSDERPAISPTAIARRAIGARDRLVLQPSLQFVVTRWPLLPLWWGTAKADVPLERSGMRLAVLRRGDTVRFLEFGPGRFTFWRRLAAGDTVETATARALHRDPDFDLLFELVFLVKTGAVAGIVPQPSLH